MRYFIGTFIVGLTILGTFLYGSRKLTEIPVDTLFPSTEGVAEKLSRLSLEEKIGQLLIAGFAHPYLDEHARNLIENYHIGGFNLLKRNVSDAAGIVALAGDLQSGATIPLFIAVDQEGGDVARFPFLSEQTPEYEIDDVVEATRVATIRAQELRGLGITMNFSPVLDYVSDPHSYLYTRTFEKNPEEIGKLGSAMIQGYHDGGIVPVAKHYPGYGNITPDPHRSAARLTNGILLETFLLPFREAVKAGVGAIMTAHVVIPEVDDVPATFSARFLIDLLRHDVGFTGVIITDDLEMVSAGGDVPELSVRAIEAGADMLISTYTPQTHIAILEKLKEAVRSGRLSEERINESVLRILTLKKRI